MWDCPWRWITYGWSCRGGFTNEGDGRCGGFLYTSCSPVGTENLSASLQDFLCQLHPNRRILLMANSLSFVAFSPQNSPVLLPPKSVCLA